MTSVDWGKKSSRLSTSPKVQRLRWYAYRLKSGARYFLQFFAIEPLTDTLLPFRRVNVGFPAGVELVVLLVVLGVEAVEDPPAEGKDGPAPGQAVAPVELVVDPQADGLDELDGVEDQAAGLEDNWRRHVEVKNKSISKSCFAKYKI